MKRTLIVAGLLSLLVGCSAVEKPGDQRHDEAIKKCQDKILAQTKNSSPAQWVDMKAHGGATVEMRNAYGVEGKMRVTSASGEPVLKNVICLASFDQTTRAWTIRSANLLIGCRGTAWERGRDEQGLTKSVFPLVSRWWTPVDSARTRGSGWNG